MSTVTKTETKWFNEYGHFLSELPEECWRDCSTPGQAADESVAYWRKKLSFVVPRDKAIEYLVDFGAWPWQECDGDKGLIDMTDDELADKVLWLASCDMRENGEWFGLVH
jgi:hypothetical protein